MVKTYTDKLLDNLPQHMSKDNASNNYKFMKSLDNTLDNIHININGLKTSIQLNTCTGQYLDDFGRLFSLTRTTGESDTIFRARIKAYFQGNLGGGSEPNMKASLANSLGISEDDITFTNPESAVFYVTIAIDTSVDLSVFNNVSGIIEQQKAAGVFFDTRVGQDGIIITSQNNIFMTQVGQTNNNQKVL